MASTNHLQETSAGPREAEIELGDFVRILWRGKWIIVAVTLVATAIALAAAFMVTKRYQATVLVAPVTKESSGLSSAGAALSEFSGLASLVGLSTPGSDMKAEAVATLQSQALTQRYIRDHDLLPVLFAEKWDSARKAWKTTDPGETPTLWKGNEFFNKKVRTVADDKKTGLITVAVTWTDPILAAKWANGIVDLTNSYLREKAIREADRNIAYLNEQAQKAPTVELRQTIYTLLQGEIKKAMLAQGTLEYSLKVVDPAVPPERKYSPQRALWTVAGFLAGVLLSAGLVIARAGRAPNR